MLRRRWLYALLLVVLAVAVAGCGGDDDDEGGSGSTQQQEDHSTAVIRIGTKNFTEQFVLGELYRQALVSKGFRVELKDDIGSTEITHQALTTGGIDMYPEYVGVLLSEVAKQRDRPKDPNAAYLAAKRFEERSKFTLLEQTPFSNGNALAVTPATARAYGLQTIGDLRKITGTARIGAPPEFRTRFEGLLGLRSVYALRDVRAVPIVIGRQYKALDDRRVQAAAVFETDGQLAAEDYKVLEDPRGVFASQRLAPIVSEATVRAHGQTFVQTVNAVSRKLTTDAMREMNAAVTKGATPATVARRFLRESALV